MMNLFARILSHGFGLIVVALLVIGFIYRGELFPEWERPDFLTLDATTDQVTEAASGDVKRAGEPVADDAAAADGAVDEAAPAPVEAAAEAAEVETVTTEAAAELADEPVSAPVEPAPEMVAEEAALAETVAGEAGVVDSSVTESASTQAEAVPEVVEALEVVAEEAEPVAGTVTETPPVTTQEAVAGQADEVPAPATAAPAAAVATSYQVLAAAREAYWLRDYALAEQKYQDLIALEPGNPDGYGELGNMYFSQGDWEQAAAAYYEAGVRLVDQGLVREARQLVEVIRGLNGSQADALEQRTRSAEQ